MRQRANFGRQTCFLQLIYFASHQIMYLVSFCKKLSYTYRKRKIARSARIVLRHTNLKRVLAFSILRPQKSLAETAATKKKSIALRAHKIRRCN